MAKKAFRMTKRPPKAEAVILHITDELEKVAESIGRQSLTQRAKVIATWNEEVPAWRYTVKTISAVVKLRVFMEGDSFGMKKWKWLDQGTKVRHAVMSNKPRFFAKTTPRIISSKVGQGHKVFVSRHIFMPGIEERLFDLTINTRLDTRVKGRVATVVKRALKRKRF